MSTSAFQTAVNSVHWYTKSELVGVHLSHYSILHEADVDYTF